MNALEFTDKARKLLRSPVEHTRLCAMFINAYWQRRGYDVNARVDYVEVRHNHEPAQRPCCRVGLGLRAPGRLERAKGRGAPMSTDIETLRTFFKETISYGPRIHEASAALDRVERNAAELADGACKNLARAISAETRATVAERERDSLRKALDDRHEADRKAWRAIMRAAGRERGLPDNKEVIAFYVAEVERLGTENASLRTIVSKCADALGNGAAISHDCSIAFMGELPSEIGLHVASLTEDRDTWKEQSDSLSAKLERVKEALRCCSSHLRHVTKGKDATANYFIVQASVILSADAPAQQPQISDEARARR